MATVLQNYQIAVHGYRPNARCVTRGKPGFRAYQIMDGSDILSDEEVNPTVAWREAGALLCLGKQPLSLQAAPAKKAGNKVSLEFTPKELELLWLALSNGAGDDAINHLGLRTDEKRKLGRAANRIADGANLAAPRFYE